jgi:hypothetical protein
MIVPNSSEMGRLQFSPFLLVDTILGYAQNSSEKRQVATVLIAFQKSFVKIRERCEPIGRKKEVKIQGELANSVKY